MRLLLLACLVVAVAASDPTVAHWGWPKVPRVTPDPEGTYQTGVRWVPKLGSTSSPCPDGYKASTAYVDMKMGYSLLEKWFNTYAMPDMIADNDKYACFWGTKREETRSVSVCMPKSTVAGQTAYMYAQGVVSYKCKHRYQRTYLRAKTVGIYAAKGSFTATTTVNPQPPFGGSSVPTVKAVTTSLQKGTYKVDAGQTIPTIICPTGYQDKPTWGTIDQGDTMARNLVDDYFKKIALPQLRAQSSPYGCPYGAQYVDGDPFFSAQVKDSNSKHTHTSSCFQKSPPAKGQTTYMYAQGIINYRCLDRYGNPTGSNRYVAVYNALGSFAEP